MTSVWCFFFICYSEIVGTIWEVLKVPETFFLGTTHVGLRCFDVSKSYFVFGSDCGALFPYNRRINRSATP